jgi:hypothetical protein
MLYGQTTIGKYAKTFTTVAMLVVAGACADDKTVAPVSASPVGNDTKLRVNNSQGITAMVGAHLIYIPAQAICDIATSGYGVDSWNSPCQPLRGSITITATEFRGPQGEPYIDFQPAMRFAPNKEVMLFFREGRTNGASIATVKYCDAVGNCVDESLNDPSLKPFRIGLTSILGRRVKHFTGYTVTYEAPCLGGVVSIGEGNLACDVEVSVGGLFRRSGYMVASGEDVRDIMAEHANKSNKDEQ